MTTRSELQVEARELCSARARPRSALCELPVTANTIFWMELCETCQESRYALFSRKRANPARIARRARETRNTRT